MTPESLTFTRAIDVRHEVDVCVVGGGPAGVAAAASAARSGRSVLLLEGQLCFGGMGTAGGVAMFCRFTDGEHFLAGGVGREIYDRLFDAGGAAPCSKRGDPDVHFRPEVLKTVYDRLLVESGVHFSLQTRLVGVQTNGRNVTHAVFAARSGMFAVAARVFVDATGDGDLCAMAGADYRKGDDAGHMQPGTFVSFWANVDWNAAEAAGTGLWHQAGRLGEAIADGVFTTPDPHMPGLIPMGETTAWGSVGHLFGIDGTDERSLTEAAVRGRELAREYGTYFRKYLRGYENMELVNMAALIGIRETRRITGRYILTLDDYLARASFPDEIGRYAYAIDIHPSSPDEGDAALEEFERLRLGPGESYGIPYRILTPRDLDNVLVAGRCVSVDRHVLGSIRVMPGCFITGQAAGIAASIAAGLKCTTSGVPIDLLQETLRACGAYLRD